MGNLIVGLVVLGIIAFACYQIYMDSKNGKGCGCSCDGCESCPGTNSGKQGL